MRSDRNLYSKNLIESQDEIAEMKRKFKIMNHQIEQLKEEIQQKDQVRARGGAAAELGLAAGTQARIRRRRAGGHEERAQREARMAGGMHGVRAALPGAHSGRRRTWVGPPGSACLTYSPRADPGLTP